MKRKSPVTASKRTTRPVIAAPAWVSNTDTSASPPEHTAGAQLMPWVEEGVTVISLLTVPGRTVTTALAVGVVPVSRTVSVTSVSAITALG
jgi:hypothetical protein